MDFFARQAATRRQSRWMIVLFLVAVVATLHPSRAAARLTPVEAIRHE